MNSIEIQKKDKECFYCKGKYGLETCDAYEENKKVSCNKYSHVYCVMKD